MREFDNLCYTIQFEKARNPVIDTLNAFDRYYGFIAGSTLNSLEEIGLEKSMPFLTQAVLDMHSSTKGAERAMVYFYREGKPYEVWSNVIAKDGTKTQERLF